MLEEPTPAPEPTEPTPSPTPTTSSDAEPPADPTPADKADGELGDDATALGKKSEEGDKPQLPEILGAPEGDYTVTAPEGLTFDKEAFEAVAPVLKEMNLSDKGAQQIVDAYASKVLPLMEERLRTQAAEQQQLATAEFRKQWLDEAKADPEIGGAKWDESIAISGKVFDAVGMKASDPFRTLLEDSGLGNHPDAIRFMRRIGQMIGEDKFDRGEGDSSADNRPIWDRVYGGPVQAATT